MERFPPEVQAIRLLRIEHTSQAVGSLHVALTIRRQFNIFRSNVYRTGKNTVTNTLVIATENDLDAANRLSVAGHTANEFAVRGVFADYRSRKAVNTLDRQAHDLARFADYLAAADVRTGDLAQDAEASPGAWSKAS